MQGSTMCANTFTKTRFTTIQQAYPHCSQLVMQQRAQPEINAVRITSSKPRSSRPLLLVSNHLPGQTFPPQTPPNGCTVGMQRCKYVTERGQPTGASKLAAQQTAQAAKATKRSTSLLLPLLQL
jgi:hypothetical protein